ncbi:helix-turn-helix transcriptional regulator [Streptomyces sp. NBC_00239]|uniref:helix-turn-helix transcriptional regulator n=1 Tax=Streptomyces sp. NBC_00239 TaxID=2903640 RepID=UPI002E2D19AB|nr:helix-turn-helix transcriptional regulator [Streptomyces sp. NBC_00239]
MNKIDIGFDDLEPQDLAVYDLAIRKGGLPTTHDLSPDGMTPQEVERSVAKLLEMRLLRASATEPGTFVSVAPQTAAAELTSVLVGEVSLRQQAIARIAEGKEALVARYTEGMAAAAGGVHRLKDLHKIRLLLEETAERCRFEVLTAQPGGARSPEILAEALPRDRRMLERGVAMRTLYQRTTRYNQPARAYVEEVTRLGAEVRTSNELFNRLIIFDRETAFIPDHADPLAAVVVREPSIVAFLLEVFERSWQAAEDFDTGSNDRDSGRGISGDVKLSILKLLAEGLKDEVIARRLGMSVRTCRKHIAAIMLQFGATSRFQGGYIAHRLHLLDSSDQEGGPSGVETEDG